MSELSLTHCKYECKYHVVFAPKFRRQVIYGKIKSEIGKILRKLCEYKGIEILEANACPYHIHMLLIIPPKYSIAQVMGYLNFYAQSSPRNLFRVCRQDREWGI